MDAATSESWSGAAGRLAAARLEFDAQAQRFEEARLRLLATVEMIRRGRPRRELFYHSKFARMQARLDTMPTIEQAKGIVMAQQRCGPEEAFDALRRASQDANVKVHVLAAQLVAHLAAPGSASEPQPREAVR